MLVRPAAATQQELTQVMAAFAAGARIQTGRVFLDVAQLVDNGNAVPATVTVDSPMSPGDHVTAIAIFNERNPQTEVASFQLGPLSGLAKVSTRIRLATTQQLVAMARMNDGSCWSHTVTVSTAWCSMPAGSRCSAIRHTDCCFAPTSCPTRCVAA